MLYIEHSDDNNNIFGNAFEFSSKAIQELKANGYNDALREENLVQLSMNYTVLIYLFLNSGGTLFGLGSVVKGFLLNS
ncbi:MAG: hypothetical protein M3044_06170 [Thermoproteota archaeon]|nr:hypothetical protein [Thermoproteota archaeon]